MKSLIIALLGVVAVNAASKNFPGFDIFHSGCGLQVLYTNELCADVFERIVDTLQDFNINDPAHGSYQFKESQPISYTWNLHKSKNNDYDDVIFETL